jgi:hypothetical protein
VRVQLNHKTSIRKAVVTLTAALVGSSSAGASGPNQSETSILVYSERHRTRATEINFDLDRHFKNNMALGLRLTFDGLTGASPTGASPSRYPQTLTRPSGGATTVVPAGAIPIDKAFHDTRFALDASLSRPLGRMTTVGVGTHLSSEHDYKSIGASLSITRVLNQKNTTIGIVASISHDVSSPVGGLPVPFTDMTAEAQTDNYGRKETGKPKSVQDVMFSVSQVLDQRTVLRVNYSLDRASGYLTDPYKVITLVQPPDSADPGEPTGNIHERRPEKRNKNAVYGQLRRFMFGGPVDLSYRYFWDDWGITAHTIDCYVQVDLKKRGAIQPHLRWYKQAAADFYGAFLVQGAALPEFASADSRLASFQALTYGLTYTIPTGRDTRLNFTGEYYRQRGNGSPPDVFGTLALYDLFPALSAVMVRLSVIHDF